jgi:phosphatidylglycerophosphate synthase
MQPQIEPISAVEATYKGREVEGVLDLYFYRPIGFRLAQFFRKMEMTPARVTLLAALFGIIAGHLFYYRDLRTNVVGMVLLVCANALDNADGQLARLTHRESRDGRIIDSVADHVVFVSIYLHLTLRYLVAGSSPAICSRSCCRDQSRFARRRSGLLPQHVSLFCHEPSAPGIRFHFYPAIRLSRAQLALQTMEQVLACIVFELYSPAGNARAASKKVA